MASIYAFNPNWGQAVTISGSTTSANATVGKGAKNIVVTNTGAINIYVRAGLSGVVATAADYMVTPGQQVCLTKYEDHDTVAVLTASSTASVHVIPGEGV